MHELDGNANPHGRAIGHAPKLRHVYIVIKEKYLILEPTPNTYIIIGPYYCKYQKNGKRRNSGAEAGISGEATEKSLLVRKVKLMWEPSNSWEKWELK